MDKNYFLAKTYKQPDGSYKTETIEEHTNKLVSLFDDFLEIYKNNFSKDEVELIKIACKTHDLGKMNSRFQKKLYKAIGKAKDYQKDEDLEKLYNQLQIDEIPHGVLSASFIDIQKLKEKFEDEYIEVLASAIYNHHERNVIDKNGNSIKDTCIKSIVDKDIAKYTQLYDDNLKYSFRGIKKNAVKDNSYNTYQFWLKFIVIKGMLNKLDYAASTYIKSENKVGLDVLEIEPNNAACHVINNFKANNYELKDCQKFMMDNSDKSIVVIASTGIGKTEGALLWAEKSKTFYTLPVKVSINAIYKRIKENGYYGKSEDDKNKVAFLHSDTRSILMKELDDNKNGYEDDDYEKKYIETKQLIHPLTVCTVDQLFYFVFKSLGTEKFPATLKYSKVIIDEIQSYSPDIIAFLIYGLKVITDLGGKFCIMTATLPPVVRDFLVNEIGKDKMKIADTPYYKRDNSNKIIQRHFIKYIEQDFNYNEIVEQAKNKKVLVICNTVKRSQEVYAKLKEKCSNLNINLLHSRFILKDRVEKEKEIINFAPNEKERNDKCGIWISTQIVEASLDIDFDILYTDMATADSLLQRMGRCYRDRPYCDEKNANVIICRGDDKSMGVGTVYDKDIFNFSAEHIEKYSGNIFSEEDKQEYINNVYAIDKVKGTQYYKDIDKNLKTLDMLTIGAVDKKITEHQFRNINNITVIPLMFKPSVDELLKELESSDDKKYRVSKIDEIKSYTTSIFYNKNYIKNIQKFEKGKIKEKYLNDIVYIDLPYDKEIGLRNRTDDELEDYEEEETKKQFI